MTDREQQHAWECTAEDGRLYHWHCKKCGAIRPYPSQNINDDMCPDDGCFVRREGHSRLHGRPLDENGGIELTRIREHLTEHEKQFAHLCKTCGHTTEEHRNGACDWSSSSGECACLGFVPYRTTKEVLVGHQRLDELEAENAALAAKMERLCKVYNSVLHIRQTTTAIARATRLQQPWIPPEGTAEFLDAIADDCQKAVAETPAQSLDAIRREAAVKALRDVLAKEWYTGLAGDSIAVSEVRSYADRLENEEVAL